MVQWVKDLMLLLWLLLLLLLLWLGLDPWLRNFHMPQGQQINKQTTDFFFFFAAPMACGSSWAQGLNKHHSYNQSHSNDNTTFLTC